MANRPVPDTISVEIRGTLLSQQVENTLYFKYLVPPDELTLQELADDIADYWVENMLSLLPIGWIGREVYVRDLSAPITVQATSLGIAGIGGEVSGDTMPSYVTKAIARRSGLTGRSSRGRIFWQGIAESSTTGNFWSTGFSNAVIAALEGIDALATLAGFTPVIVSRFQAGVELTTPLTYPVSAWLVTDNALDTRRSRKLGHGS